MMAARSYTYDEYVAFCYGYFIEKYQVAHVAHLLDFDNTAEYIWNEMTRRKWHELNSDGYVKFTYHEFKKVFKRIQKEFGNDQV